MPHDPGFLPIPDPRPADAAWPELRWPPPSDIRLVGDAVELSRCLPEVDAEPLYHALDHDVVWRYLPARPSSSQALADNLRQAVRDGRFPWILRLRAAYASLAAGTVIGTSSYLDVSVRDARLEIGATAYAPSLWATKVNPEAKLLLLTCAFETLLAGRVQLKTDVRNLRSQRAIAGIGARYEGTLRRHQRRADGSVRDSVLFSITAEDWPAVKAALVARLARGT